MKTIIGAALVLVAAFALAATDTEIAERLRQAEPKGKEVVLSKLKDPMSAQFRNVRPTTDGLYLCGEVNAKNSYGGYIGFKKFYSLWAINVVEIEGTGNYIDSIYKERCEK